MNSRFSYVSSITHSFMKKQVKILGLSFGLFAFSFGSFLISPAMAQESVEDWICCLHPRGIGCVDKGGVFWPNDIKIIGSQPGC